MLDAETLVLLTKLKIFAKKAGVNIDLVKMGSDNNYAELTLGELSNAEDADLVAIVIQLMNQFGMIKAPTEPKKEEEKKDGDRYIGSLR
jgi:hypothetical protein